MFKPITPCAIASVPEIFGKCVYTKSVIFQQTRYQFLFFQDIEENNQLRSTSAILSKPLFHGLILLKVV